MAEIVPIGDALENQWVYDTRFQLDLCEFVGSKVFDLPAQGSSLEGLVGFGRVYVAGASRRLSQVLLSRGWQMVPREQEAANTRGCLFHDEPVEVLSPADLAARRDAAAAYISLATARIEGADGHFFEKPVRVIPWECETDGPAPGFYPGANIDLLVSDVMLGMSRRGTTARLVREALEYLRETVPEPRVALVREWVDRRARLLDQVRQFSDRSFMSYTTPPEGLIAIHMTRLVEAEEVAVGHRQDQSEVASASRA